MPENKKDPTAASRKKDHIGLAFESNIGADLIDKRFYYEPVLATMTSEEDALSLSFLGKNMSAPIWVSSMTGGTKMAAQINCNLAKVCREFGLGMGLGSCRQLLDSDEYLGDFAVRDHIGDQPLYANLGIAQVIDLIADEDYQKIESLVSRLEADGLIIHINPLQEWMQPEGDIITRNPISAIEHVTRHTDIKIVVKEVGQGFGPASLEALLKLDIAGIELAGFGGTNFTMLEKIRSNDSYHEGLINVGHTATEMVNFLNDLAETCHNFRNKHIIISGGVKDYLTGYYLNSKCTYPSVYGQASAFLKYAVEDYKSLATYVEEQIKGYQIASQYLKAR